jgi:hypothetical protein
MHFTICACPFGRAHCKCVPGRLWLYRGAVARIGRPRERPSALAVGSQVQAVGVPRHHMRRVCDRDHRNAQRGTAVIQSTGRSRVYGTRRLVQH